MNDQRAETDLLPVPPAPAQRRRARRPALGLLVVVTVVFRFGREILQRVAFSAWGLAGVLAVIGLGVVAMVAWRFDQRRRQRARGGDEFTPEMVVRQFADSGLEPPAFEEDGSLLGASVLVVNQKAKLLEVNTEYEIFGWDGRPLGTIRQIGQSKARKLARIFTGIDQFLTHHFDIVGPDGATVLRVTRPRKLFRTKLHVFDGHDQFLGTIRQQNVFWKIRFQLVDRFGGVVGHLRAENLRAWDFKILDTFEREVAEVVKSWEGWARTAFTRADRYAVRVHEPLADPLRQLTIAAALATDLALKQDARAVT